jgi:hypothetical protein
MTLPVVILSQRLWLRSARSAGGPVRQAGGKFDRGGCEAWQRRVD